MKTLEQSGRLRKIPHHDETVDNFSEDNRLFVAGVCFLLDGVRYLHDLGDYDK